MPLNFALASSLRPADQSRSPSQSEITGTLLIGRPAGLQPVRRGVSICLPRIHSSIEVRSGLSCRPLPGSGRNSPVHRSFLGRDLSCHGPDHSHMYRSNRLCNEMPSSTMSGYSASYIHNQIPDSPSGSGSFPTSCPSSSSSSTVPNFLERLGGLPLVRAAVSRIQELYEGTKERHELLRGALERGEHTVNSSYSRAADIVSRVGLTSPLRKSLSIADSSACFVLDKVETKLPIISKSPYEIKLMIADKWEGKMDQVTEAKETAARFYDGGKSFGTQTIDSAKDLATLKAQALLKTPVGTKVGGLVDGVVEGSLTLADSAVDRFLPEAAGHSLKNGNGSTNGNAAHYSHTNGTTNGYPSTLDHARSLSRKVKRRVSARSTDVVDSLMQHSTVSSVAAVARKNIDQGRQVVSGLYSNVAHVTGRVVDLWCTSVLLLLPKPLQAKLTLLMDGLVEKMEDVAAVYSSRRGSAVSPGSSKSISEMEERRLASKKPKEGSNPPAVTPKKRIPATPGNTFLNFLRGWIALVGMMALANTLQCFVKPDFVWEKLYNVKGSGATPLAARTYGMWTLLAAMVRFTYSVNIHNWELFLVTLSTFLIAFGHFVSEMLVFRSGLFDIGMLSPILVSGLSVIMMLVAVPLIWPRSATRGEDVDLKQFPFPKLVKKPVKD
ncbi:putative ergosterol biosynthetic protein 28 [Hypsibius exemplaris]|uniref:Ergosterol biosynthetic protein 28 n=1 Tax=Hypsibius exemplaris TaxID=2072580 RepID=A0A1W0WKU9_HYPEX|nr:putative ergosterol biosynthetic protein 28 [Hypsibius exemplaris]